MHTLSRNGATAMLKTVPSGRRVTWTTTVSCPASPVAARMGSRQRPGMSTVRLPSWSSISYRPFT